MSDKPATADDVRSCQGEDSISALEIVMQIEKGPKMRDAPAITKAEREAVLDAARLCADAGSVLFPGAPRVLFAYESALSASEASVAELREALAPFADAAPTLDEWEKCPDDEHLIALGGYLTLSDNDSLTFGDFRRARAAYERGK